MKDILIYIELPPYLSQWLRHDSGGQLPVRFRKGSIESKLLSICLTRHPPGEHAITDTAGAIPVALPDNRYKPPETFNYLPHQARSALKQILVDRFDIEMWSELHSIGCIGRKSIHLIEAWMEAKEIEPTLTNTEAVVKRYRRCRDIYNNNRRQKKFRKKNLI